MPNFPPGKALAPPPYLNRLQPMSYKPFGPIMSPRIKPDIYDFHNFKYLAHEPPSFVAASTSDSGIKELEKAFGNPEVALYGGDAADGANGDKAKLLNEDIEVNEDNSIDDSIKLNNRFIPRSKCVLVDESEV